jgi:hypothetical protein
MMKRVVTILFFVGAFFCAKGQSICDRGFDKAVSLYNSGKYKDAKMQFTWCQSHCKDRASSNYQSWIDKCDKGSKTQAAAYQKRRQAETEAIEQQKREAKERKERVERNKYIYLSVSNAVEGHFSNIEYELEDNLYDIDTSLKFTRDSSEAYWFVRIVVNIYGDQSNSGDKHFYYVESTMEVENALTAQVRRGRVISEKDGTMTIPEERAPEWVANKIYSNQRETFYNRILETIKKYLF